LQQHYLRFIGAYQYTLKQFQFPPKLTFYSIHRFYCSFVPLSLFPVDVRTYLILPSNAALIASNVSRFARMVPIIKLDFKELEAACPSSTLSHNPIGCHLRGDVGIYSLGCHLIHCTDIDEQASQHTGCTLWCVSGTWRRLGTCGSFLQLKGVIWVRSRQTRHQSAAKAFPESRQRDMKHAPAEQRILDI
jgi:hypothetical protein